MNSQRLTKSGRAVAAKIAQKILIRFLFYFATALLVLQFDSTVLGQGFLTVGDYANRLNRAERTVDDVMERESPAPALVVRMNAIKRLLPAREEIELNGSVIRVDNAWLHEALDNVIKNAGGDIEQRHSMLREISDRLAKL